MRNFEFIAESESQTIERGRQLGDAIKKGGVIYLNGTLGAGKTTFCRGVLSAFGYSGSVKSPTYTLVEPYNINGSSILHFDLYRLGSPEELEFIGIRDYFDQSCICLIEWPEKGLGYLPDADMDVIITPQGNNRIIV